MVLTTESKVSLAYGKVSTRGDLQAGGLTDSVEVRFGYRGHSSVEIDGTGFKLAGILS